jgi:hypothetical protein
METICDSEPRPVEINLETQSIVRLKLFIIIKMCFMCEGYANQNE